MAENQTSPHPEELTETATGGSAAPQEPTPPPAVIDYRKMFDLLKSGAARKLFRQSPTNTAWIIDVDGHLYREVYSSKNWRVHYDLLSDEEARDLLASLQTVAK